MGNEPMVMICRLLISFKYKKYILNHKYLKSILKHSRLYLCLNVFDPVFFKMPQPGFSAVDIPITIIYAFQIIHPNNRIKNIPSFIMRVFITNKNTIMPVSCVFLYEYEHITIYFFIMDIYWTGTVTFSRHSCLHNQRVKTFVFLQVSASLSKSSHNLYLLSFCHTVIICIVQKKNRLMAIL